MIKCLVEDVASCAANQTVTVCSVKGGITNDQLLAILIQAVRSARAAS